MLRTAVHYSSRLCFILFLFLSSQLSFAMMQKRYPEKASSVPLVAAARAVLSLYLPTISLSNLETQEASNSDSPSFTFVVQVDEETFNFDVPVDQLDALSDLSPTIGDLISMSDSPVISLKNVSYEAFFCLHQMLNGNFDLQLFVSKLSQEQIDNLKQEALFLDSKALQNLLSDYAQNLRRPTRKRPPSENIDATVPQKRARYERSEKNLEKQNKKVKKTNQENKDVKRITVRRNNKPAEITTHVSEEQVANALVISENADVYDEEGQFLFGIRHNVLPLSSERMVELADIPVKNAFRGPAAGPLDFSKIKMKEENKDREKTIVGNGFKFTSDGGTRLRNNPHYSLTVGRTYLHPNLSKKVQQQVRSIRPELVQISKLFKQYWPSTYSCYHQYIKENHYEKIYLPKTVFSSAALNTHSIDENGVTEKDSRAAIHLDKSHPQSVALMLTLKENIEGGDLFLPEFGQSGVLFKLGHGSLICFKGVEQKHAVSPIQQAVSGVSALRFTMVAFLMPFSDKVIKKIK